MDYESNHLMRCPQCGSLSPGNWNNAGQDHGKQPYVVNINRATKQNGNFRTAIWIDKLFYTRLWT